MNSSIHSTTSWGETIHQLSTVPPEVLINKNIRPLTLEECLEGNYLVFQPWVCETDVPYGTSLSDTRSLRLPHPELDRYIEDAAYHIPLFVASHRSKFMPYMGMHSSLPSEQPEFYGRRELEQFHKSTMYVPSDHLAMSSPQYPLPHTRLLKEEDSAWRLEMASSEINLALKPNEYESGMSDQMYLAATFGPDTIGGDRRPLRSHIIEINPALRSFMAHYRTSQAHPEVPYTFADTLRALDGLWFDDTHTAAGTFNGKNFDQPPIAFTYSLTQAAASLLCQSKDPQDRAKGSSLLAGHLLSAGSVNAIVRPCIVQAYSLAIPTRAS